MAKNKKKKIYALRQIPLFYTDGAFYEGYYSTRKKALKAQIASQEFYPLRDWTSRIVEITVE